MTVGPNDRSNNDLCVSVLNSFGIETDTFGDPRFCKGPPADGQSVSDLAVDCSSIGPTQTRPNLPG